MSEEFLNEDLTEVEGVLRSLEPVASRVDVARAMYLAGRASATGPRRQRGRNWLWPSATAIAMLSAATFAWLWCASARSVVSERTVYVERDRPAAASQTADRGPLPAQAGRAAPDATKIAETAEVWEEYLRLQQVVLTGGADALPKIEWRSPSDREPGGCEPFDDPLVRRLLGG